MFEGETFFTCSSEIYTDNKTKFSAAKLKYDDKTIEIENGFIATLTGCRYCRLTSSARTINITFGTSGRKEAVVMCWCVQFHTLGL